MANDMVARRSLELTPDLIFMAQIRGYITPDQAREFRLLLREMRLSSKMAKQADVTDLFQNLQNQIDQKMSASNGNGHTVS